MRVMTNHVKKKLKEGKVTSGAWLNANSNVTAEITAHAGFDWLLIDMEHGPGSVETLISIFQAMSATETIPVVRAPWNDLVAIKRILDAGAYGIMVPWVNNAEQAEQAVQACKYPPRGIRGAAGPRATGYGRYRDEYYKRANDEVLVILQCETGESVDNIEEIMQVPDVDMVFIGPNDLSWSLGLEGDMYNPEVESRMRKVENAAKKYGVALGTISSNWEHACERFAQGYQMVTLGGDSVWVMQGANQAVANFKKKFGG